VKVVLFVLPLGLDTFAVAATLGMRGLSRRERLQAALLMSSFELAMPVVGLLLGRGLGRVAGNAADYVAIALLALLGVWMVVHEEHAERERVTRLAGAPLLVLLTLGISISLDELAIGFTIGLLHLSLWLALAVIAAQAFLLAQLGLRLGAAVNERFRKRAERLAGVALLGLAALFAAEHLG
jgi:putative Mn2+ efflux pump MntP